jgi:molybdopterin-guanine dinucleotide biosynthesis protein A
MGIICAMLTVVIQAGGQSSRMGRDKALLPFLGQPLITRLIARLTPVAVEILITTNHPADYAFLGLPLFTDKITARGALGGLYTAIEAASQPRVAVVACDMPFANPTLLQFQSELLEAESVDVVIPRSEAGYEPLHTVYRRAACLPAIEQALQAEQWKVISWFPSVRVRPLSAGELAQHDPRGLAFVNVNTPEEFSQAENLARQLNDSRPI